MRGFVAQCLDDAFPGAACMIDDMGIFHTPLDIASHADPKRQVHIADVMVDTGSELNWIPRPILEGLGIAPEYVERFETADGRIVERDVGFALLYVVGRVTSTHVVFADPADKVLLGAIGIEGLNLRIDLVRKELVPAGPVSVAAAA
jgi:predicted aspartyl protease